MSSFSPGFQETYFSSLLQSPKIKLAEVPKEFGQFLKISGSNSVWSCAEPGVGLDDPFRSLPIKVITRFHNPVCYPFPPAPPPPPNKINPQKQNNNNNNKKSNHANKIHNFLLQFLMSKPHVLNYNYQYSIHPSSQGKGLLMQLSHQLPYS